MVTGGAPWRYKFASPRRRCPHRPFKASTHLYSEFSFQPRMGDIQTRPFSKDYRSATLHDDLPLT